MIWGCFIYFAVAAVLLWTAGAALAWMAPRRKGFGTVSLWLTAGGVAVLGTYIIVMWVSLGRPPLRTMGETRLWYSLFISLCGLFVWLRQGYRWILSLSALLATVFVCINIFNPEIHDKTLMPALQSIWFVPHVIVYMLAYALLGVATLVAIYSILMKRRFDESIEGLVQTGWAFLTVGMLFGALWAKEAWGHYWSWDPKETWAAVTWLGYLAYIHLGDRKSRDLLPLLWLILCFILLQMCWWGINYLPSAQATSIHTYAS